MRAMRLAAPAPLERRPLVSVDVAPPRPGRGELVLEVTACAVCRTDLQICEGDIEPRHLPLIPGHQIVGRVHEVGDGTSGWREGERAGVGWLASTCGECRHCRSGRENLCESARFTGWDRDGGYAGYVAVRADFALRLPDAFDDVEAAPLLCGGVIGYRALKASGIRPGERLGLFGFGASASLAIQIARSWGCRVFVCTRSSGDRERARAMGAEWAGGYEEAPPEALDGAVTFAPAGSVVIAALGTLDRGATVAINAIHLDQVPAFSYDDLWWERSIRSVANSTRDDARELLDLAARIPIRTSPSIYPLSEANRALEDLRDGAVAGAAVLDLR